MFHIFGQVISNDFEWHLLGDYRIDVCRITTMDILWNSCKIHCIRRLNRYFIHWYKRFFYVCHGYRYCSIESEPGKRFRIALYVDLVRIKCYNTIRSSIQIAVPINWWCHSVSTKIAVFITFVTRIRQRWKVQNWTRTRRRRMQNMAAKFLKSLLRNTLPEIPE